MYQSASRKVIVEICPWMTRPYVWIYGGDTRRPAVTRGELDGDVEEHQPSSKTCICSFVCGGTGGALPESYRMTSSRLLVCMSATASTRVALGSDDPRLDLCSKPGTVLLDWPSQESTTSKQVYTGGTQSLRTPCST